MQNLRVDNVQPLDLKSPVFVELHIRFLFQRRGIGYLYVSMNRHQTQLYLSIVDFPIETIQNLYLKSCFRSSKRFIQNATLPPPDLLWLKMTFLDQNIFKSNSETAIHFMGKRFEWKHFEQRNTNIYITLNFLWLKLKSKLSNIFLFCWMLTWKLQSFKYCWNESKLMKYSNVSIQSSSENMSWLLYNLRKVEIFILRIFPSQFQSKD